MADTHLRIPEELHKQLRILAIEHDRSLNAEVAHLLKAAIKEQPDAATPTTDEA